MKFSQSTSLTRIVAIVIIVGVIPTIAFHIGSVYAETVSVLQSGGIASL